MQTSRRSHLRYANEQSTHFWLCESESFKNISVIVLDSRQMARNCKNCKFCIQARKRGWRHASVRHTPSNILFRQTRCREQVASGFYLYSNEKIELYSPIITLLPFCIEMLLYDWLWSGHMIIKEMFHIPTKLKFELARDSMTTSDVNNQWRSNFQQQIN